MCPACAHEEVALTLLCNCPRCGQALQHFAELVVPALYFRLDIVFDKDGEMEECAGKDAELPVGSRIENIRRSDAQTWPQKKEGPTELGLRGGE